MPLNILRLNARHLPPTDRIVFIKPLPDLPDSAAAASFLERVAAICHPILSQHHLSVTTLEEFEPNKEFVGRNFNNGEVIQLVLRTRSGGWIPFRSVVMVMMHELAHNVHMNHGRKFWEIRNGFAGEMRVLWERGYTGEGVWGRGRDLEGGGFEEREVEWGGEGGVQSLCGGTFRSRRRRGRKRRRRDGEVKQEELSYAERKARRIERKFGKGGEKLGSDEDVKSFLEGGKKVEGAARVANSGRGRELRPNAALVRLGAQKVEEDMKRREGGGLQESEEDSGALSSSDYEEIETKGEDSVDLNGSRLLDGQGQGMVRVCEDEDFSDAHVKQEMEELQGLRQSGPTPQASKSSDTPTGNGTVNPRAELSGMPLARKVQTARTSVPDKTLNSRKGRTLEHYGVDKIKPEPNEGESPGSTVSYSESTTPSASVQTECSVCSMSNDSSAWLCSVCSNVLKPHLSLGSWKCASDVCRGSQYLNPGDYGTCGICGAARPP